MNGKTRTSPTAHPAGLVRYSIPPRLCASVVKAKWNKVELKKVYEYDISTQPGKTYTIKDYNMTFL